VAKEKLDPSGLLLFAGDINADPGNLAQPHLNRVAFCQGTFNHGDSCQLTSISMMSHLPTHLKTPLNTASQPLITSPVPPAIFSNSNLAMSPMTSRQTNNIIRSQPPLWQRLVALYNLVPVQR